MQNSETVIHLGNTLLHLHNSSYHTQPHSIITSYSIAAKPIKQAWKCIAERINFLYTKSYHILDHIAQQLSQDMVVDRRSYFNKLNFKYRQYFTAF